VTPICYLRGNASPDLRAACQRVIVRGDGADPADLGILKAEVERRRAAEGAWRPSAGAQYARHRYR
jgi:hypothetical protein